MKNKKEKKSKKQTSKYNSGLKTKLRAAGILK